MNKITVIQLLNKIANREEVPEKIIWNEDLFEYDKGQKAYIIESINGMTKSLLEYVLECDLNEEVEIIEEEKLMFEEIKELSVPHKLAVNVDLGEDENSIQYKVNQLIRNQKKLIKELEELKKGK